MSGFTAPVDIGNRALQHCGAERISTPDFSENSRNCSEVSFCYDKLRLAELERRNWSSCIKEAVLRPIDQSTMLLDPSLWMSSTTYFVGSIVTDETGMLWISNIPSNSGNDPLLTTFWDPYFGPMSVQLYDSTGETAYNTGEIVYVPVGDGTYRVYLSMISNNADNPATATAWDTTVTYFKNQAVTFNSVAYMSLVDLNFGNEPDTSATQWTSTFTGGSGSLSWLEIGGSEVPAGVALSTMNIIYPLGAGPARDSTTRNVYRLPAGFLRLAPQNPKPGLSYLGGPVGNGFNDWLIEGPWLMSMAGEAIVFRFVANLTDVTKMHPMLCEGLALRVAIEICETVTQSSQKVLTIGKLYDRWMTEAGMVDGIEQGFTDPPEDDLITVRW